MLGPYYLAQDLFQVSRSSPQVWNWMNRKIWEGGACWQTRSTFQMSNLQILSLQIRTASLLTSLIRNFRLCLDITLIPIICFCHYNVLWAGLCAGNLGFLEWQYHIGNFICAGIYESTFPTFHRLTATSSQKWFRDIVYLKSSVLWDHLSQTLLLKA